jgi:predicted transcriptional regulator
MMNPGSLTDWPLREQRALFSLLGDVQATVGVELTNSLLMVPTKSVSGIFFPAEESFASCQLCPREACPNRRAPYDPELYDRKYRATQMTQAGS